jgi:hypothetical protein
MRKIRPISRRSATWTRRGWLSAAGTSIVGSALGSVPSRAHVDLIQAQQQPASQGLPLRLTEFEPKSMLHVKETSVPRARFPVIDFHTHVSRRRA